VSCRREWANCRPPLRPRPGTMMPPNKGQVSAPQAVQNHPRFAIENRTAGASPTSGGKAGIQRHPMPRTGVGREPNRSENVTRIQVHQEQHLWDGHRQSSSAKSRRRKPNNNNDQGSMHPKIIQGYESKWVTKSTRPGKVEMSAGPARPQTCKTLLPIGGLQEKAIARRRSPRRRRRFPPA